jgi:hypothetical protein
MSANPRAPVQRVVRVPLSTLPQTKANAAPRQQMIETLLGSTVRDVDLLTPTEGDLIARYRALSSKRREIVRSLLEEFSGAHGSQ